MILPFRLSDTQRTVVAYFVMFFSILCMFLSCATTTYSYLQHVLVDDISRLVRGYYASDALLTISIVGTTTGTVYAIGCYICFRITGSRERKVYNDWLMAYLVMLIIIFIVLGYAVYECYTELQKPAVKRSLEVCMRMCMFSSHCLLVTQEPVSIFTRTYRDSRRHLPRHIGLGLSVAYVTE